MRVDVHKAVNWQTYCMAESHCMTLSSKSQCITSLSLADISIYSSTKIIGIREVAYSLKRILKLFPLFFLFSKFSVSVSFQMLIFLNINVCPKVFHLTHNSLNFSRELLFVKQLNILQIYSLLMIKVLKF
jgi:hypothetical protein